jgi:hypothetical protein
MLAHQAVRNFGGTTNARPQATGLDRHARTKALLTRVGHDSTDHEVKVVRSPVDGKGVQYIEN